MIVRVVMRVVMLVAALAVLGCAGPGNKKADTPPPPTKPAGGGVRDGGDVRDTVYRATDRNSPAPPGFGLYTVLLSRSANRNSVKVLAELFTTTVSADEALIPPAQLNLVTIPTRDDAEATALMGAAREQAEATATTVMARHYDYGQAALLLASLCRPERGPAIMAACGSSTPTGPILVTSRVPFDGRLEAGQQLLVVNLGTTSPAAVAEMMAAYRRQVLRKNFRDRAELDSWRLAVLTGILDAAQLLPGIKASAFSN